ALSHGRGVFSWTGLRRLPAGDRGGGSVAGAGTCCTAVSTQKYLGCGCVERLERLEAAAQAAPTHGITFRRQIFVVDPAFPTHWSDGGGICRCALAEAELALANLDWRGAQCAAELRVALRHAGALAARVGDAKRR